MPSPPPSPSHQTFSSPTRSILSLFYPPSFSSPSIHHHFPTIPKLPSPLPLRYHLLNPSTTQPLSRPLPLPYPQQRTPNPLHHGTSNSTDGDPQTALVNVQSSGIRRSLRLRISSGTSSPGSRTTDYHHVATREERTVTDAESPCLSTLPHVSPLN